MNKEEKANAYLIAHEMIEDAKKWAELREKDKNNELVVIPALNRDGSRIYAYQPPNPEAVAIQLKKQIREMDDETKNFVFDEIFKVTQKTIAEIDDISDLKVCGPLQKIIVACNALNDFKSFVEKEKNEELCK